ASGPLEPPMTALDQAASTPHSVPGALRLAPMLYAVTLFLSALLLFAVQPMFTKMVLPRLGGAPTVWSVAMVFFQTALLAGYAYAHLLVRRLSLAVGAFIHLAVLAVAAATLPIGIAQGFGTPPTTGIAFWLIGLFAALFVVRHANVPAVAAETGPVSWRDRLMWTALAAIPAGLVIAVTSYITTDIAAAPFLWVLPLALYLLTFVAVFRDRAWLSHATVVRLVPILVAPLAIALLGGDRRFWLAVVLVNLLASLLLALLCAGGLSCRRPVR